MNILISGYHGFGNTGDEAILLAMKNNILSLRDGVRLTALSYRPEDTKAVYGIDAVQRFNLLKVLRAVADSDIVLSGGGSLLQDETSTRSLLYYLSIILLGKLLKKKVMLYANGIGPVNKKFNRRLIKWIVNKVDLITLREESSEKEVRRLGIVSPEIHVTADPVFTLLNKGISGADALARLRDKRIPTDKKFFGVSVREWKNSENFMADIAAVCDSIAEQYGYTVLFIPMQYPRDINISEQIKRLMKSPAFVLNEKYRIDETLGIIGLCELIFSMRLHTLIFAGLTCVPMLGIVYEPKVSYYLDVLGMPSAGDLNVESLCVPDILDKLRDLSTNRDDYAAALNVKRQALCEKGQLNEYYLDCLLKSV